MGCDNRRPWRNTELGRISTHTSRVGCDQGGGSIRRAAINFYSHIPCGMWHSSSVIPSALEIFLLTHPVWDVTCRNPTWVARIHISTHTSRVGCDRCKVFVYYFYFISTHTSRVGCDTVILLTLICLREFLLTHPVWDVTSINISLTLSFKFLLTHPVWDVTSLHDRLYIILWISTHTSRVGCDADVDAIYGITEISTHTSRVGCDRRAFPPKTYRTHFYSHIPCGMWLKFCI